MNNNNNKLVDDEGSSSDVEILDNTTLGKQGSRLSQVNESIPPSYNFSSATSIIDRIPQFICTDIKNVIIGYLSEIGIDNTLIQSLNQQIDTKIDNQYNHLDQDEGMQQQQNNKQGDTNKIIIKKEKSEEEDVKKRRKRDGEEDKRQEQNQFNRSNLTLLSKLNTIYHVSIQKRVNNNISRRFKRPKTLSPSSSLPTSPAITSTTTTTTTSSSIGTQQQEQNKVEIQIQASREEISKRIQSFIARKKLENSEFNARVFRSVDGGDCARVAPGLPQKIKSSVTVNNVGPTPTSPSSKAAEAAAMIDEKYEPYINERCSIIEEHIGVLKPIPTDIYSRVKKVEDRIVEIEQKNPAFFKDIYDQRIQKQKSNRTISHQPKPQPQPQSQSQPQS